ncbi:MAG TPA: class I SAM-dependent methyltransferase [Candidatus Acidoferrales bacterium]|nr:class I SAM-dependent methyltransferase [Candidatus Acidoferrales bacterium]
MASSEQLRRSQFVGESSLTAAASAAALVICPLCGAVENETAFTDSGCELRVCRVCELFFVHPYPSGHRQHEQVVNGKNDAIELLNCDRRYAGERLYYDRHFSSIAEECEGAASLLDVGCGTGNLLERMAARPGLYRAGIELNPQAARMARRVAGCEITQAPFEDFQCRRRFDVITMINVLSHIPSFARMFRAFRAALAPGGKVILRTSEMTRNVSRWNQVHWGIPDDLHFLGAGTLDFLCAKYGFSVTRRVRTPYEEELFRHSRWQQMGRSAWLNLAKCAAVRTPGALPALKRLYQAALGQRLFVSFIVLRPFAGGAGAVSDGRS